MDDSDEKMPTNHDKTPADTINKYQKKPYTSPTFVEYGSVAKLTQAGGVSQADGPVGFMMN